MSTAILNAPSETQTETTTLLKINAQTFKTCLESVVFCCDTDSYRYALGAVQLRIGVGCDFVATDGRRLAWYSVDRNHAEEIPDHTDILIPRKTAKELIKRIGKSSGMIEVQTTCYRDQYCVVWTDKRHKPKRVEIIQQEGRFPKWRDVIPADGSEKTVLSGKARQFTTPNKETANVWEFSVGQTSARWQKRKGCDTCNLQVTGDPVSIGLDADYLGEWIDTLDESADVTIDIKDNNTAIVGKSGNSTYVLMPCNLDK